jgi:hypothetical protein
MAGTALDLPGGRRRQDLTADQQVKLFGRVVHGDQRGFVELAAARREGGRLTFIARDEVKRFPRAWDHDALALLARDHRNAGEEVFCSPLPRSRPQAGKGAVEGGASVWVDLDSAKGLIELRRFRARPHLVLSSGSGTHAYWVLSAAVPARQIEAANRKLAARLGGDLACCDRGRIMRLPGSWNAKARRHCEVLYCDLARSGMELRELTCGLADPDPPAPAPSPAEVRRHLAYLESDQAAQLAPPAYFRLLAGVQVSDRGGHAPCPLPGHQDAMASCMVYADADAGWHCYGCSRGGAIYDLASLLDGGSWGRALRGEEFRAVKRRVHDALGLDPPPTPRRDGRPQRPRRREASAVGERR